MPSPDVNESQSATMSLTTTSFSASGQQTGTGFTSFGSYVIYNFIRLTSSVRTLNYKSLKSWQLPLNPYSFSRSVQYIPKGRYVQREVLPDGRTTLMDYTANCNVLGAHLLTHDASIEAPDPTQRVVALLQEEIRLGRANSAVTAAELHKTASHVAKTATRLHKAITALRGFRLGDFASALGITYTKRQERRYYRRKRILDDYLRKQGRRYPAQQQQRINDFVADTWLEYSYGWKPLIHDLYQTAEACASLVVERQGVVRVARKRAMSQSYFYKSETPGCRKHTHDITSKKWIEIELRYRIPSTGVPITTAFGLNNPLEVAWELVPFSFVADWFLPIGSYLSSLTAYTDLEFHDGWKTSKHQWSVSNKVIGGNDELSGGNTYQFVSSNVTSQVDQFTITRSLLSSFPVVSFPDWKDPRSFAHAASAIALLQSLFLRK